MRFHLHRYGNKVVPLQCTKRNFWILSCQHSGKSHEEGHTHEYYCSNNKKKYSAEIIKSSTDRHSGSIHQHAKTLSPESETGQRRDFWVSCPFKLFHHLFYIPNHDTGGTNPRSNTSSVRLHTTTRNISTESSV